MKRWLPSRVSEKKRGGWLALLIASVCFEGLARRYVSAVPGLAWYVLKDFVLVGGLIWIGVGPGERRAAATLYRPFGVWLVALLMWSLLEVLNPSQQSLALALLGMRAYSLWWIAPLVVATALKADGDRRWAINALAATALVVAAVALIQFGSPNDALVNRYAWGGEQMGTAMVAETGRVRVISTFSYLSGFSDFAVLSMPLLLALGLAEDRRRTRWLSLLAAGAIAVTVPMSGSRGAVLTVGVGALPILWSAGTFATKRGLRLVVAAAVLALLPALLAPEAVLGVRERFQYEDTGDRFRDIRTLLPVFALTEYDYPFFGVGTGMQQNAREAMGIRSEWSIEGEQGRYLVELGVVGYLLIWTARLGIVVALLRAFVLLRRRGRKPAAGLALTLAGLTFLGNITFDHVWQALFFMSCGFVLREVVASADVATGRSPKHLPARAVTT